MKHLPLILALNAGSAAATPATPACESLAEHEAPYIDQLCQDREALTRRITEIFPGRDIKSLEMPTPHTEGTVDLVGGSDPDIKLIWNADGKDCIYGPGRFPYGSGATSWPYYSTLEELASGQQHEAWSPNSMGIDIDRIVGLENSLKASKAEFFGKIAEDSEARKYYNDFSIFITRLSTVAFDGGLRSGWSDPLLHQMFFANTRSLIYTPGHAVSIDRMKKFVRHPDFSKLPPDLQQAVRDYTSGDSFVWDVLWQTEEALKQCNPQP
ncbi:TPA: hypothetical protein DCW56_03745 [Candidatus Peregrinibacteria bacterium]|nr:hypothetical protein [Candidatus Peregrinibacteria bacterium]